MHMRSTVSYEAQSLNAAVRKLNSKANSQAADVLIFLVIKTMFPLPMYRYYIAICMGYFFSLQEKLLKSGALEQIIDV